MNKKIAITQSNYIPWKGYIDTIISADDVILYDDMQYTKRDWRNRNLIVTPSGLKWMSIPVNVSGKFNQSIYEVELNNNTWCQDHWNLLTQNYKKAAYFNEVEGTIKSWYEQAQVLTHLSQVNTHFLQNILDALSSKKDLLQSNKFQYGEGKSERLLNLCKQRGATEYLSGPKAKDYLDISIFEKENIKVSFSEFNSYNSYTQLQEGFDHGVTILDLFFNLGFEGSKKHMKSFDNQNHIKDE
tara:strand:- start:4255 stop:4980 length:726 start_codon:yes stop_codon:yes gene_type:complete